MKEWIYRFFLFWYACGVVLVAFDILPKQLEWANAVFLYVAGIVALIFAINRYGKGFAILTFVFVLCLSILIEFLGVRFGVVFGTYHYEKDFGMQIAGVPLTIGFAWTMVILTTHAITIKLLSSYKQKGFVYLIAFVMISSLLAVVMDLIIDPVAFQAKQYWVWEGQSFYYNIPLQNFVGWFLTSALFQFLLYPFWSRIEPKENILWEKRARMLYFLIIFMFILTALRAQLLLATSVVFGCVLLTWLLLRKVEQI